MWGGNDACGERDDVCVCGGGGMMQVWGGMMHVGRGMMYVCGGGG